MIFSQRSPWQSGQPRPWPQTFRALRHRNFRLFWSGQLISLIGTWMQSLAQQWLVYRLTGQAINLGLISAITFLPILLLAPFAGVLVDRVDRRKLILGTTVASMLPAIVLAVLTFSGVVQFWHILAMAGLLGLVGAIDMPARQSFVVELIDDRADLMNAIALNSLIFNGARAIGPAIAGLLVGAVGEGMAFSLNAISYVAVIGGLLMLRLPPPGDRRVSAGSALSQLAEGLRYALATPVVRTVLLLVLVPSIFGISYVTLLPIFANEVLAAPQVSWLADGARRLGLLMTAQGVGALLGALGLARAGHRRRRDHMLLGGATGFALAVLALAATRSFWLALPIVAAAGYAMITFLATANTTLQTTTPDELRGRVMGFYTTTLVGLGMIGSLLAGWAADAVGAPLASAMGAAICLVAAGLAWRSPVLRELGRAR